MNFNELSDETKASFANQLETHLKLSEDNLKKDKFLLPMLMVYGKEPDSHSIFGLESVDGGCDVDVALEIAIDKLKHVDFSWALYSYSTQLGSKDGSVRDALKTYVFNENGMAVVFFTPYEIKGIIKKSTVYDKTIIAQVIDNIFE